MRAVTLLSGGLDSTTLAYYVREAGYDLTCLSFDYGQRHKKELEAAHQIAKFLGAEHHTVRIEVEEVVREEGKILAVASAPLGAILGPSVLVDATQAVPDGHYADENMKQTVVPNRNAIMISIAYAVALAQKAYMVAFAAHSGDHRIYPDCRPEFVKALSDTLQLGARWDPTDVVPYVMGPFLNYDKTWIALEASKLGVPIEKTWSCYKGGDIHCGTCGTCYERREAFFLAQVEDPTEYLDSST